jgi:hypothetical protein
MKMKQVRAKIEEVIMTIFGLNLLATQPLIHVTSSGVHASPRSGRPCKGFRLTHQETDQETDDTTRGGIVGQGGTATQAGLRNGWWMGATTPNLRRNVATTISQCGAWEAVTHVDRRKNR